MGKYINPFGDSLCPGSAIRRILSTIDTDSAIWNAHAKGHADEMSLSEAVALCKHDTSISTNERNGLLITFRSSESHEWEIYQFAADSKSETAFTLPNNWKKIGGTVGEGGTVSVEVKDHFYNVEAVDLNPLGHTLEESVQICNADATIAPQERVGMIITFKDRKTDNWTIWQYNSFVVDDASFVDTANWQKVGDTIDNTQTHNYTIDNTVTNNITTIKSAIWNADTTADSHHTLQEAINDCAADSDMGDIRLGMVITFCDSNDNRRRKLYQYQGLSADDTDFTLVENWQKVGDTIIHEGATITNNYTTVKNAIWNAELKNPDANGHTLQEAITACAADEEMTDVRKGLFLTFYSNDSHEWELYQYTNLSTAHNDFTNPNNWKQQRSQTQIITDDNRDHFFNVEVADPQSDGHTLQQAINICALSDSIDRDERMGIIITYRDHETGIWQVVQYNAEYTDDYSFKNPDNWHNIKGDDLGDWEGMTYNLMLCFAGGVGHFENTEGQFIASGDYAPGTVITVRAVPDKGYRFVRWDDNSTEAERIVLMNSNKNLTAIFDTVDAPLINTLWVNVNGRGQVVDADSETPEPLSMVELPANASIYLRAVAEQGYTFEQWENGDTTPLRTVVLDRLKSITAYFSMIKEVEKPQYALYPAIIGGNGRIEDTANAGAMIAKLRYEEGETLNLLAVADAGYHFLRWEDGSEENPRQMSMYDDKLVGAYFERIAQEVPTDPTVRYILYPSTIGGLGRIVDGNSGTAITKLTYLEGETVSLRAVADENYEFVCWEDNTITNPRQIVVDGDRCVTARFRSTLPTPEFPEFPELPVTHMLSYNIIGGNGRIVDNGTNNPLSQIQYEHGSSLTLRAVADDGYSFDGWEDKSQNPVRTITMDSDRIIAAIFSAVLPAPQHTLFPSIVGGLGHIEIEGEGDLKQLTFNDGEELHLLAVADDDYEFVRWEDGSTENPRTLTMSNDTCITALFRQLGGATVGDDDPTVDIEPELQVRLTVGYYGNGHVNASEEFYTGGMFDIGSSIELTAVADDNNEFVRWDDGSEDPVRTVLMDSNRTVAAYFRVVNGGSQGSGNDGIEEGEMPPTPTHTVTALYSGNGSVAKDNTLFMQGVFDHNSTITLTAVPDNGAKFVRWEDGTTDATRSLTVVADRIVVAYFKDENSGVAGDGGDTVITPDPELPPTTPSDKYSVYFCVENGGASIRVNNQVVNGKTLQYDAGTEITVDVTPYYGHDFDHWHDGNTECPRLFVIDGNMEVVAWLKKSNTNPGTGDAGIEM